ncbi:MAG: ribosome maturation factor RimM [Duncaniella sp.]|nr:ribosome maturation factor RimM [Duncaniella sp.]
MIHRDEIVEIGIFNKPHGIKGEVSASLDFDMDLVSVKCIIIEVDGIFVPFFIKSVRPKTAETCLITIDGVNTEQQARSLAGRHFYILKSDLPEDEEDDEDGFYLSDLVGYKLEDVSAGVVGEITDYNDATANVLFIVTDADGNEIYVPATDEYIDEIDTETKTVFTDLPAGIIDLNI